MEELSPTERIRIKELIEISHYYGGDDEYVIAGGGNTSYKTEDKIWIKASGTSLSDIEEDGFVCLSRSELKKISTKTYSQNPTLREARVKEDLQNAVLSENGKRPSVETSLHEIIDFDFVVHTHPSLVNALMCSKKARKITRSLFDKEAIFINYTDPGLILFKKVEEKILRYRSKYQKEPSIIFLQNHGVFVSANNIEEIKSIYSDIFNKINSLVEIKLPVEKGHHSVEYAKRHSRQLADLMEIDPGCVVFRNSDLISYFLDSRSSFEKIALPFTPDDIVYCKSNYLYTDSEISNLKSEIENFTKKFSYRPKIIALKGKGILAIDENENSAKVTMEIFINMMKVSYLSENFGGPQFMTPEQIHFIDNWEVENYRRQMSKGKGQK